MKFNISILDCRTPGFNTNTNSILYNLAEKKYNFKIGTKQRQGTCSMINFAKLLLCECQISEHKGLQNGKGNIVNNIVMDEDFLMFYFIIFEYA